MTVQWENRNEESPFTLSRKGEVSWFESPILAGYDFITHAFCTREGGVSRGPFAALNLSFNEGDDDDAVERNRSLLAETFDIPKGCFRTVRQVHGDRIVTLDADSAKGDGGESPAADGIITTLPGWGVAVRTADCVPILYADVRQRVVGVVHAGWKGTAKAIASRAEEVLVEDHGCRLSDIRVAIGPAIGPCCYEVDETVHAAVPGYQSDRRVFTAGVREGRWMFDLAAANRLQLTAAGIGEDHIDAAGLCTSCNGHLFFSHRGDGGRTGRQLSFIMLHTA